MPGKRRGQAEGKWSDFTANSEDPVNLDFEVFIQPLRAWTREGDQLSELHSGQELETIFPKELDSSSSALPALLALIYLH